MKLDVSTARANPDRHFAFDLCGQLPEQDVNGEKLTFAGLTTQGRMIAIGETLRLDGVVRANAHMRCADCLDPAQTEVVASFDEVFAPHIEDDDTESRLLSGHAIDMEDILLGALMLQLPMRILCREDCPGLCPVCGVKKSVGCACDDVPTGDNPFLQLKDSFKPIEEV